MSVASTNLTHRPSAGWFARAEAWLDERGRMAWIGATVLGFIVFWPIGLALLAYMLFFRKGNAGCARPMNRMARQMRGTSGNSGNSAFDAYRAETLRRLEEEQDNFEAFLARLRDAKDKAEFDQFMDERARAANADKDRTDDAA